MRWYAVDKYEAALDSPFTVGEGYILLDEAPIEEGKLPTYILVNEEDEDLATVFSAYYLPPASMPQANGVGVEFARLLKYVSNRTHPSNVESNLPDEATVKSIIAEELINQYQETEIDDWETIDYGANISIDLSVSTKNMVTLSGNTIISVTNVDNHDSFLVRITQDATGSRTVTWNFTVAWLSPSTISSGANEVTVYGFTKLADGTYIGYKIGETQ